MSMDYISFAKDWLDAAEDIFSEKQEEWKINSRLGIQESNISRESDNLNDIIEVIRWYQHQIHVKLRRAIKGKLEEKQDYLEKFPNDSDGSAKVALIGIDRTIAAWGKMLSFFPEKEDETFKILVHLEKLQRKTEKEFPNARLFIRPGFDEK